MANSGSAIRPNDVGYDNWLKGILYCKYLKDGLIEIIKKWTDDLARKLYTELDEHIKGLEKQKPSIQCISPWVCTKYHLAQLRHPTNEENLRCKVIAIYNFLINNLAVEFTGRVLVPEGLLSGDNKCTPNEENMKLLAEVYMRPCDLKGQVWNTLSLDHCLVFLLNCRPYLVNANNLGLALSIRAVIEITHLLNQSAVTNTLAPERVYQEAPRRMFDMLDEIMAYMPRKYNFGDKIKEALNRIKSKQIDTTAECLRTLEMEAYEYKIHYYEYQLTYWTQQEKNIKKQLDVECKQKLLMHLENSLLEIRSKMEDDCVKLFELILRESGVESPGDKGPLSEKIKTLKKRVEENSQKINCTMKPQISANMATITTKLQELHSKADLVAEQSVTKLSTIVDHIFKKAKHPHSRRGEAKAPLDERGQHIIDDTDIKNSSTSLKEFLGILRADLQHYACFNDKFMQWLDNNVAKILYETKTGKGRRLEDEFLQVLNTQMANISFIFGIETNSKPDIFVRTSVPKRLENCSLTAGPAPGPSSN